MTRFKLYHTVTDTLGRVVGELYELDNEIHQPTIREPTNANTDVTERVVHITKKQFDGIMRRKARKSQ